jgi:hypothetical protein
VAGPDVGINFGFAASRLSIKFILLSEGGRVNDVKTTKRCEEEYHILGYNAV